MLDVGSVRNNLRLVEEKLRARGADAAIVGDFHEMDQNRRAAITKAEKLKASLNELSRQVGTLKKSREDASAVLEEIAGIKANLSDEERIADELDKGMWQWLARIPNLVRDDVPPG